MVMLRTQIYLSEHERQGLQALALCSGGSQSAPIREWIDAFLQQQQPQGRQARLRQARGLWAERPDQPIDDFLRDQPDAVAVLEGTEHPLAASGSQSPSFTSACATVGSVAVWMASSRPLYCSHLIAHRPSAPALRMPSLPPRGRLLAQALAPSAKG
jgi:hypothetical protein